MCFRRSGVCFVLDTRHTLATLLHLVVTLPLSHFFNTHTNKPTQAASGEDAAKSAWSGASIDLPSLLPSFANGAGDVDKVVAQYEGAYLLA